MILRGDTLQMLLQISLTIIYAFYTSDAFEETISVPIANITEPDTYLCYTVPVEKLKRGSIVGYKVSTTKNVAHHVAIAILEEYSTNSTFWNCRRQQGRIGKKKLIALTGKEGFQNEHSEYDFPEDIGIELGKETGMKYILIQVHYKDISRDEDLLYPTVNVTFKLTEERRPYLMQKLMLVSLGYIPPQSTFSSEIAIRWTGQTIHPFNYYMHTHDYGLMAEGYVIKKGKVFLIGSHKVTGHANPIYKIDEPVVIEHGDIFAARCIYRNNETFPVKFGVRNQDEMCNVAVDFKYAVDDSLSYPLAIVQYQSAQNSTWCSDVIPGTKVLCDYINDMANNM